jgi:hypothetical protein
VLQAVDISDKRQLPVLTVILDTADVSHASKPV